MPPVSSASMAASVAYLIGSPPAMGAMIDATSSARAASGPTMICRDDPNNAYATAGTNRAYRPATGERPATSA